jgi:gluconokinase
VRLVYLKGDMALIGDRISRRKNHFMPPALLKSQFDALEEPQADEHALSVPIVMPPRRVVDSIVQQLGITLPAQG